MCGIVGINATTPFTSQELLSRLKKLEYRGYDSYGYWNGRKLMRQVGKITVVDDNDFVTLAISHTRWATHGGVTVSNAHPHQVGMVTLVHNGIIENYQELKTKLEAKGALFTSQTDTEVLAHHLNHSLQEGLNITKAIEQLMKDVQGTFALLIMLANDLKLYAAKRDSPLALGIGKDSMLLASDIYAFSDITKKAIFFENDEYAIIQNTNYTFYNIKGNVLQKEPKTFEWNTLEPTKKTFAHFMLKEIHEQPEANKRLLQSLETDQHDKFDTFVKHIKKAKKIVFTAAGTAYHASLLGASFLHQQGIPAQAIIASEFENFIVVDSDTLVIAVSQSGETMDVIESLKYAKEGGATILAIVNVPYSTIERMASHAIQILAGQEVAVASTKAFTNQATMMLALAKAFGYRTTLENLPANIDNILASEEKLKRIANELYMHHDLYVLGRKLGYPIAREIALKIKEISYIHAEGMMGGELKHGTIALIEQGTPVLSIIYDDDARMRSSTKEVEARGARTITIGTCEGDDIRLPATSEAEFSIHAGIVGQILAYYMATALKRDVDRPRNLAKSCTVL